MRSVYFYDTTLRDGLQTYGINMNIENRIQFTKKLISFGIDFIEGGFPYSNKIDEEYFKLIKNELNPTDFNKIVAFGMVCNQYKNIDKDPQILSLLNTDCEKISIVCKSIKNQIAMMNIDVEEYLVCLEENIKFFHEKNKKIIMGLEHFFDGFKDDRDYCMKMLNIFDKYNVFNVNLADTRGGILPFEVDSILKCIKKEYPTLSLAIHCHNDEEMAVANSIIAVHNGVETIQGTINGIGERVGNANLTSLIPIIVIKTYYQNSINKNSLKELKNISEYLNTILKVEHNKKLPFVGEDSFAHKGGLHLSCIVKNPQSYNHIDPILVGNKMKVSMSDLSGKANVQSNLKTFILNNKVVLKIEDVNINKILEIVKQSQSNGFNLDGTIFIDNIFYKHILKYNYVECVFDRFFMEDHIVKISLLCKYNQIEKQICNAYENTISSFQHLFEDIYSTFEINLKYKLNITSFNIKYSHDEYLFDGQFNLVDDLNQTTFKISKYGKDFLTDLLNLFSEIFYFIHCYSLISE